MAAYSVQEPALVKSINRRTFSHVGILDTGWHQHAEHQLIYAEGGVLYVLTSESQFLLPAYHGAWVPAYCTHKLLSPSEKTKLWLLYFQPQSDEIATLQNVRVFGISPLAREMLLYTERWSIPGTKEEQEEEGISRLEGSFYETIRLLATEWCEEPLSLILPVTEDGLLGEITSYILDHMEEPLNIQVVAHIHGVSGRTLMRLFRHEFGITFGTYLRIARIVKAVELLTQPHSSILDVAYSVGYNSPSSFSQAFRKLTGMAPQTYVARIR
ncbi:MAG: helix-turn-helix transcriptional regulator [Chloroflexota bacterium]